MEKKKKKIIGAIMNRRTKGRKENQNDELDEGMETEKEVKVEEEEQKKEEEEETGENDD